MKSNFKFMDMNFVKLCITYVLHYVSGAVRWLDMFVVRYVYKVIDLSWNICSPEQLQQSFTTLASSCNSSAIFMVMTQISFLFYSVSPALASDVPGPGELGRSDGVGVWLHCNPLQGQYRARTGFSLCSISTQGKSCFH